MSVFYDHLLEAAAQTGLPVVDVAKRVRDLGIIALDCSLEHAQGAGFDSLIREAHLAVASIYAFYDFAAQPEPAQAYPLVERAASLGAPWILPIPGFVSKDALPIERERSMHHMATALRAVCSYAAERGVGVTLEDFDDDRAPYSTTAGLLWFMEQVPALHCAFDTGNFAYSEENELDAFRLLSSRVVHVHCKDRSLTGASDEDEKFSIGGRALYASPVGAGFIKMGEVVEALQGAGYGGYYTIEHFGARAQLDSIAKSAAWLLARARKERR